MNTKRLFQIGGLVVSVLIGGCASAVSVADLRKVNEGSSTFVKKISYDDAYRIIVAESRRCFSRSMSGAKVNVNGDIYADKKSAEVSVEAALMTSSIAEILFDIRATSPTETEIKSYYRKQSTAAVVKAMRAWLDGNTTVCEID